MDPGTTVLGFALVEVSDKQLHVLHLGVIRFHSDEAHEYRLERTLKQIQKIIQEYHPSEMAIEAPFFGKNVQSMLKLGRSQGVAIAAAIAQGLNIAEYSPKKIKQAVTGNGNATKKQVAAMLTTTLKVNLQDHLLDASDALAAAVCHYYTSRNRLPGNKSTHKGWQGFISNNPERIKGT